MPQRSTTAARQRARIEAGRRVAVIRDRCGLTQVELARRASLPQSTMSSIESGARGIQPDQRARLAEVLAVDGSALDPAATPDLDPLKIPIASVVPPSAPAAATGRTDELPPGLEGFLERCGARLSITERERQYLVRDRTETDAWLIKDDGHWERRLRFWRTELEIADRRPAIDRT